MRIIISLAFLLLFVTVAFAAEDQGTVVSVPWGNWIVVICSAVAASATPLILLALRSIPGPLGFLANTIAGQILIQNAVDFAVNAVPGAAKGKKLDINVGSKT